MYAEEKKMMKEFSIINGVQQNFKKCAKCGREKVTAQWGDGSVTYLANCKCEVEK